jgi:hypothetical protein
MTEVSAHPPRDYLTIPDEVVVFLEVLGVQGFWFEEKILEPVPPLHPHHLPKAERTLAHVQS